MRKVLVVDDTTSILKMVKFVLGDKYELYLATSGKMALSILEKKPIELVLMDVDMPEMDGIETVAKIREIEEISKIPVIFFTALASKDVVEKCLKVGMVGYIIKPYKPEDLLEKMEETLSKSKYEPKTISEAN